MSPEHINIPILRSRGRGEACCSRQRHVKQGHSPCDRVEFDDFVQTTATTASPEYVNLPIGCSRGRSAIFPTRQNNWQCSYFRQIPRNLLYPQVSTILNKVGAVFVRRVHARRAVDDGILLYARAPALAILGSDVDSLAVPLFEVEGDGGEGVAVLLRGSTRCDICNAACAVSAFRNGKVKHSRICRTAVCHACLRSRRACGDLPHLDSRRRSACARCARGNAEVEHRRLVCPAVRDRRLTARGERGDLPHLDSSRFTLRAAQVHCFGVGKVAVIAPRKVAVGVHGGREGRPVLAVRAGRTVLSVRTGCACRAARNGEFQNRRILRPRVLDARISSSRSRYDLADLYRRRRTVCAVLTVCPVSAVLSVDAVSTSRACRATRYREVENGGVLRPHILDDCVCASFARKHLPDLDSRRLALNTLRARKVKDEHEVRLAVRAALIDLAVIGIVFI